MRPRKEGVMPDGEYIDFRCPGCGKGYRSGLENAGEETSCPDCGSRFTIPSAAPLLEPDPPVREQRRFLADRAGVSSDALIGLRSGGQSWWQVLGRFGLGVQLFYLALPENDKA